MLRIGAVLEPAARQDANAVETLAGQRQRDRRKVTAATTDTAGMNRPPIPKPRMNGSGMKTSIARPIATAVR